MFVHHPPYTVFILPLNTNQASLEVVGGKGMNLARLAQAGFPVPDGFLISTAAYHAFVNLNRLEGPIQIELGRLADVTADSLETCSQRIRALFEVGSLPPDLEASLKTVYQGLGAGPVAVRSSATAEDLPSLSFAGQQDTYLNVMGFECLREALIHCWSSLWTARAIGYRARNGVDQRGMALGVVVQQMVESRAAGVLFTANPLSGLRAETVIDATLGLGEALVSGQVEPDHYVVDPQEGRIRSKELGAKSLSIHGRDLGGTQTAREDRRTVQALNDEQILELAQMGRKVQDLYGSPQDIEWAEANGLLYLLQSRPITSLFPIPEGLGKPDGNGMTEDSLQVLFSFGAVQGLLEPITPIGRDALQRIFARGAGLFGIQVNEKTQRVLYSAGERLWINFSSLMKNEVGRKILLGLIDMIEPGTGQALRQIQHDPQLIPGHKGIRPHARLQIARFLLPVLGNIILNLLFPEARRKYTVASGEKVLDEMRQWISELPSEPHARLIESAGLLDRVGQQRMLPTLLRFVSGVASGMVPWNALNLLASHISGDDSGRGPGYWRGQVLEMTRGMSHNPTTEMDLALWKVATLVRADADSFRAACDLAPAQLAEGYLAGNLPATFQSQVAGFLSIYGLRGLGEIDLGRARWAQNPLPIFEMLVSFLQIEDADQAPDAVFARGAQSAAQAVERVVQGVRTTRHGRIKALLARLAADRARRLMGLRESPKFFIVRMLGLIQTELLACGSKLAKAGELDEPGDLVYLSMDEIKTFANNLREAADLIQVRREAARREALRRQIPRLLLSDGRAFYEGLSQASPGKDTLNGSPVSPGVVEGRVRVVLDPHQAHLQAGEILVCPGTDPSWTPLFLSAAGLVMEVGGMMTHGAVVAREYGIPAIVGVDRATTRLQTGQLIRVDGSSGQILILEAIANPAD